MEFIDTHAHLDEPAFSPDCDETVTRAVENGLTAMITIGTTAESSRRAVELADRHLNVYAAVGIQPNYVADATEDDWRAICEMVQHPKVVAIGETGLDRYWDYAPIDQQIEYFRRHLQLSRETQLPFIVHCRDADDDVLSELRSAADTDTLCGVMHAFSSNVAMARSCLELGLHISFAGMVTYKKNESLREVASMIPMDRIVIETDCPYLSPTPKRGQRNEPAFVAHTARCLAETRGMPLEAFAEATTRNARSLFKLPLPFDG